MTLLTYTFRTFPYKDNLPSSTFVFGKLKADFICFQQKILAAQPNYIVGVAYTDEDSRFEPIALNAFGKNGIVSKGSAGQLDLYVPPFFDSFGFKLAQRPTRTFCNWTMFKTAEFLSDNRLPAKLIFMHVRGQDVHSVKALLGELNR